MSTKPPNDQSVVDILGVNLQDSFEDDVEMEQVLGESTTAETPVSLPGQRIRYIASVL